MTIDRRRALGLLAGAVVALGGRRARPLAFLAHPAPRTWPPRLRIKPLRFEELFRPHGLAG